VGRKEIEKNERDRSIRKTNRALRIRGQNAKWRAERNLGKDDSSRRKARGREK